MKKKAENEYDFEWCKFNALDRNIPSFITYDKSKRIIHIVLFDTFCKKAFEYLQDTKCYGLMRIDSKTVEIMFNLIGFEYEK